MHAPDDTENLYVGEGSDSLEIQQKIQRYAVENKKNLYSEAERAKELWGDEADKFIRDLIKTGSVDKAREGSNGIPTPKPKNPPDDGSLSSSFDKGRSNGEPPSILDWKEFITYAAKCSGERTETQRTMFSLELNDSSLRGFVITPSDSEAALLDKMGRLPFSPNQIDRIVINWERQDIKTASFLKHRLTKANLDVFFEKCKQDLPLLKQCLNSLLSPLNVDGHDPIVKPNLKYVATEPEDTSGLCPADNQQTDKGYAIVVAGESGSGKSVFSLKQAQDNSYQPLYFAITSKHLVGKPTFDFVTLKKILELAVSQAAAENQSELEALIALKNVVNAERNYWALRVLNNAIATVSFPLTEDKVRSIEEADAQYKTWIQGTWSKENRPEKVAIIVDEGTDIDLAEGLISQVRGIMKCYSGLAQNHVLLIIAGVGLDAITEDGRVGTNPAHSALVVMKSPRIDEVKKHENIDEAVLKALDKGTFACILKTNSRMLFRSVLPILQLNYLKVDTKFDPVTKKTRYADRLVDVASFRPIMDHAVRFYVDQNSLKDLEKLTLFNLLLQSFVSHLVDAMKNIEDQGTGGVQKNTKAELNRVCEFEVYKEIQENPSNNFFARGLGSKAGTSNALKFMACFGLTCGLRPQFGDEFEELTALHFMRYMETQGYLSRRCILKYAWPPAKRSNLEELLKEQEKDELHDLDSTVFTEVPESKKLCLVFSQGTPSAQGGDVLALLVDFQEGRAELETIQCKHRARKPSDADCRKWWESLGVKMGAGRSADLKPTDGSAGHSYKGLQAFCRLLTMRLNQSKRSLGVSIGKRTLAVSLKTPLTFPIPEDDSCRVWFREMFEPTLSVLPLREAATNDQMTSS